MLSKKNHIIDFHMHVFPDAIASRTKALLSKISGIEPCTDLTLHDTLRHLKYCGIDSGVVLQIATKPSQQNTINHWAAQIQNQIEGIVCFGSVHPDAPDALEELCRIKELGLYGVKFHPDYQNFFVSEQRLYPLYEQLEKLSLPVIFHAGKDPLSPDLIHAPIQQIVQVANDFPKLTVIAAHLGGLGEQNCLEQTLELLTRKNLYLDFSMAFQYPTEHIQKIIRSYGADKILFATDCPWGDGLQTLEYLHSLNLTSEQEDLILHKNAKKLLNLHLS